MIIVNNRSFRYMTARVTGQVQTDRNWVTLKIRLLTRNAQQITRVTNWQIMGNVWGQVDFLKHFTFRTSIGGNVVNSYFYGVYISYI